MIKSVSIQNFEAHEDTTIEFGEGMNSIVGLSNSGKSAIIRALMVVVDNEWSKEMVRTGFEFCRVKVETERGWVEAERGEKVNRWRCQEGDGEIQFYQKVGTTVPELATKILGMGKRERGGGIAELPNFQTQLEKHYMLSEIGEKKATSNMIAVMMDNAIGLGGMEDLIKDFSSDLVKDKKWLTEKQEEIVDLKTGIIDESIFNQHEKDVENIGKLKDVIETMDSDISVADNYLEKYVDAKSRKEIADKRLASIPECNEMYGHIEDIKTIKDGLALVEKTKTASENLEKAETIVKVNDKKMTDVLEKYRSLHGMIGICEKVIDGEKKLDLAKGIAVIDSNKMDEVRNDVLKIDEKINDAETKLDNARDLWKRQSNATKEAKSYANEQSEAEKEFEDLKKELGVCPLCGNKL
jgi:hypothetical protein